MSVVTETHAQPTFSRSLRLFAWLSFIAEVLIIATGGAVRLTGSGLGCSEWPLCTPDSLIPLPEQGYHGVIEFANRTLTGVVGILAIVVLLLTLRAVGARRAVNVALVFAGTGVILGGVAFGWASAAGQPGFPYMSATLLLVCIAGAVYSIRKNSVRRDLTVMAWIVLVGIVAQAFVGGITVLTDLNPVIVGFHYICSLLLVCVTVAFLVRVRESDAARERAVPLWFGILSHITGLALAVTIFFGVMTTGSGPHSGDANVKRDGFDASFLAHVHSWPGYILAGLIAVLLISGLVLKLQTVKWTLIFAIAVGIQIVVGVIQARDGLPPILVGIHMVLAALSASAYTVLVFRTKRPAAPVK